MRLYTKLSNLLIFRHRFEKLGGWLTVKHSIRSYSNYDPLSARQFLSQIPGNGSVDLSKDDSSGIATILINHPERKNAINGRMMVDFANVVCELENWKLGRGVIVHGVGNTFCSGADITLVKSATEQNMGADMSRYMQDTLMRLFKLPLVTIALIEGRALGGGAELAIACDFRAMSSEATFGFVQVKMGLSPGWGGGVRLVELLGRTAALKILTSAKVMKCNDAKHAGLVDVIVPDGPEAVVETKAFLNTLISSSGPEVIQAAKRVVVNGSSRNYEDILLGENEIFKSIFGGKANIDAINSKVKFS